MSEVFKTFPSDDIQIRDYVAHKAYDVTLSGFSASYDAEHPMEVNGDYIVPKVNGLVAKADRFTEFNSGSENLNSAIPIPSRSVWDNLWHMYYRDWPNPSKVFCTSGDSREYRELYDTAYVISVPYYMFGNAIKPNSVHLSIPSTPAGTTIELSDDGHGNLYNSAYATSSGKYKDVSLPQEAGSVLYLPFKDLTPYQYMPSYGKGFLNEQIASGSIKDYSIFENTTVSNRVKVVTGSYYGTGIEFTGMYGDSTTIPTGLAESKISTTSWSYAQTSFDPYNVDSSFEKEEDFALSFYLKAEATQYDTNAPGVFKQTIVSHITEAESASFNTGRESGPGSDLLGGGTAAYPFRVDLNDSGHLHFSRRDTLGNVSLAICDGVDLTDGVWRHILLQKSGSTFNAFIDFAAEDLSTDITSGVVKNTNDIILGAQMYKYSGQLDSQTNTRPSEFSIEKAFRGSIDEFRIYSGTFSTEQINYMSASSGTGRNHWGNVFYEHGQIVVTHPSSSYLSKAPETSNIRFKATTKITENLYSCEIKSNELNNTLNPSTIENFKTGELKKYTTDEKWSPYITRIGLYNDAGELLVIGSIAQPVFKIPEYDMTFVVRFDT